MQNVRVLIAIDGSHDNPVFDMPTEEYNNKFKNSHVRKIFNNNNCDQAIYIHGPAGSSYGVGRGLRQALTFLVKIEKSYPGATKQLYLIGFSRGAAMCLEIANKLLRKGVWSESNQDLVGAMLDPLIKQLDRSSITVRALGMFDAVDMAMQMRCGPVHALVDRSVLIRRAGWHSREGWTNVGEKNAAGRASDAVRDRQPLIGTHGAMGGQPANGDIPIPLARELVKAMGSPNLQRNELNWTKAAIRWRQIKENGGVENIDSNAVMNAKIKAELLNNPRPYKPVQSGDSWITIIKKSNIIEATYQNNKRNDDEGQLSAILTEYCEQNFAVNKSGFGQVKADEVLYGFPGIKYIFKDIPIAKGIIDRYVELDKKASANAMTLMRKGLGQAFPATF